MWEELPIINTWDAVVDEGVCRGHSNWQLYGSRKPGHKAYELTGHYNIIYNNNEWEIEENDVSEFNLKDNFQLLSAQYNKHKSFEVKEEVKKEYEKKLELFYKRNKKTLSSNDASNSKKKYALKNGDDENDEFTLNSDILDKKIDDLFTDISSTEYEMKEIHSYVMILPDTFYGAGSYDKWIRVGWALKNTSDKLFLSWVKMSSKSNEFSFDQVEDMYEKWQKFEYKNEDALTSRSIIYWAKNHSLKEFFIL
jgi:3-phenylpropionate/cinnamic acid dioxygenase small subunit